MAEFNSKPPKWAEKLVESLCPSGFQEEVLGDLYERFQLRINQKGTRKAKNHYWLDTLVYSRHYLFKRSFTSQNKPELSDMLRNYYIITLRNIARNKAFSFINIFGLAFGMTCCIFIYLWVQDERGMDNFHQNGNNLYNIYQTIHANNQVYGNYTTPVIYGAKRRDMLLDGIKEAIPEIENINYYATGYELPWGHLETFQVGEKIHKLEGGRAAADFFKMFSYEVLAGDPEIALNDKSSIAISRKMANMFYNSTEEAIGKSIKYEDSLDFKITTVFEDVSPKSSLKFDFLINWGSHMTNLEWASDLRLTTVLLREDADIAQVEAKINQFYQTHADKNNSQQIEFGLQPFKDRYLISNFENGIPTGGRIDYIEIFSGVAIFILLIACINFMNLSTARSVKRAKEVGVRKVIGSTRFFLIGQFLGEAIILSFFSILISILLVQFLLPFFNNFTGKQITIPFQNGVFWLIILGLAFITGFLSGSYPALYLSSLKPVSVLKGVVRFTRTALWFRKGLTIFQFSLTILLMIATLVITKQSGYVQNQHLGYDKENLIYIRIEGELEDQQKYNLFKNEALGKPGIAMVDRSTEAPHAMEFVVNESIDWEGKTEGDAVGFKPYSVGLDFVNLMGLEIVEGRSFNRDIQSDSADGFLVNEEAVRQMNMENPIGKWISAWQKKGHIIGVLKDFHTHSLHEAIKPVVIDVKEYEYFGVILVRTEPGKTTEALASLENIYNEINPDFAFDYQFADQEYASLYKTEQVFSKLSNAFAILAIIISCLGLLGLVMFSTQQRTKEIGIRKVLGASVTSIISLFSKDFIRLVALSFFFATPISWLAMNKWLQSFAYKIELTWWIFAIAGLSALLVALLTISFQVFKAAISNPVESLKNE